MVSLDKSPSHKMRKHHSSYVSLMRAASDYNQQTHWIIARIRLATMGMFLLERFRLKMFAVWFATYHYVPLLACVMAIWINCMLSLFFHFVFPALREKYRWSMYSWREVAELPPAHDALIALCVVLAHVGAVFGLAVLGYKLMSVVTDAMIDSCLVVNDEIAKCNVGFHRLLRGYQLLYILPYARILAFILASCISIFLVCIFNSDSLIQWDRRGNDVFFLFLIVNILLGILLVLDFWRNVDDPLKPQMIRWWRKAIPLFRRRYLCILASYCIFLLWKKGCSYAFAGFCEGMVYICILHVVLLLSGKIILFFHGLYIFATKVTEEGMRRTMLLLYAPLLLLLVVSSTSFFSATFVFLQLSLLCSLASGAARRWQRLEFQIPMNETTFPVNSSKMNNSNMNMNHDVKSTEKEMDTNNNNNNLNDYDNDDDDDAAVSSCASSCSSIFSLSRSNIWRDFDWRHRPGVLFRAFHRLTFAGALILVVGLALWVSVKHPGLEGATPTRCESPGPHRIRVTARYMIADLYGLHHRPDPRQLLYEEDETKYNAARHAGLCARRWGTDLHAADLAYFSLMAYLQRDSSDFTTMLNFYRRYRDNASDWVVIPTNHTYGRAVFRHIYSPSKNTSVIAVRGTDITSPFDILQNMLLFSETFVFKMLTNILPLCGLIPERVIVDYVAASSAISSSLLGSETRDYYHLHVEDYVSSIKSKHIILTGHSLGGVVAHIVAARMQLPGVAFSSPGINLMRKKLSIDPDAIDAYATNVIVSNDFTVTIDTPGGTVHHILCEHKTAEVCHSIELHAIRMWTVCPSYRAVILINGTYTLNG